MLYVYIALCIAAMPLGAWLGSVLADWTYKVTTK
jgi:hypothetical protein